MKEEGIGRRGRPRRRPSRRDDAAAARLRLRRLMTHNRFTPVNRNADPMLDSRRERGIAVFNAAPYAGGVLAKGADLRRYVYQEARPTMHGADPRDRSVCARHGVPPGAVALQFSMRDPRDRLDDLRRDPARAGAGDPRLGGVADPGRALGRARKLRLLHRRSGGDARLQARLRPGLHDQSEESGKPAASKGTRRTSSSSCARPGKHPRRLAEDEGLDEPRLGVDEPDVAYAMRPVDGALLAQVEPSGARREDLANPVGGEADRRRVGKLAHPFAPPAGQIGDQDVRCEVQLRLDGKEPAAGAARSIVEAIIKARPELQGRPPMARGRAGVEMQACPIPVPRPCSAGRRGRPGRSRCGSWRAGSAQEPQM